MVIVLLYTSLLSHQISQLYWNAQNTLQAQSASIAAIYLWAIRDRDCSFEVLIARFTIVAAASVLVSIYSGSVMSTEGGKRGRDTVAQHINYNWLIQPICRIRVSFVCITRPPHYLSLPTIDSSIRSSYTISPFPRSRHAAFHSVSVDISSQHRQPISTSPGSSTPYTYTRGLLIFTIKGSLATVCQRIRRTRR